ncbi:MAG: 50S ribosomal protein L11 methyltransferase [Opitutales bacterium]|nr:50S ribosomal protein L11 methyltransferase [Opitutales bacterium]
MIEVRIAVDAAEADALEAYFCEDYQEHWMLYEDEKQGEHELRGFFDHREAAQSAFGALGAEFPALRGRVWKVERPVADTDWKEAYKLHFRPWSDRGLHWVPVWEADDYPLPEGDCLIPLDPGMAFGTGNHETTRLCVRRLLDARDAWGADNLAGRAVIDAGCGSGILALSARKLGFSPVEGFDNDPDSVAVSVDNARLCGIEDEVAFRWSGLEEGLAGRSVDILMANILADVLCENADLLLGAVRPGGWLILSGILAREADDVARHFRVRAGELWPGGVDRMESRGDGDWADVLLVRAV